ncbi:hypothetical protein PENTCL1PPCAC_9956, partial [Pristionchus entomophagus]
SSYSVVVSPRPPPPALSLSMAGRKRKAVTPSSKESGPSKRAAKKAADDAVPGDDPASQDTVASVEETTVPSELDFSDLPFQFVVQMVDTMTFKEMAVFRLSSKKALEAVDHCGRAHRALDIVPLIVRLWPEMYGGPDATHIDSLYTVRKEMARLTAWLDLDLITSIDFDGIGTLNCSQLETVFGTELRGNIKMLNLVGNTVMPDVWATLARLFPGVKTVRFSEAACQFPDEVARAMELDADRALAAHTLVDQQRLLESGLLAKERLVTLRCVKRLFPTARFMYVE